MLCSDELGFGEILNQELFNFCEVRSLTSDSRTCLASSPRAMYRPVAFAARDRQAAAVRCQRYQLLSES